MNINAVEPPGGDMDPPIAWARRHFDALAPYASGGVYVNFLGQEGDARVRAAYSGGPFERLVALKAQWDPHNVFRMNQNIRPGG